MGADRIRLQAGHDDKHGSSKREIERSGKRIEPEEACKPEMPAVAYDEFSPTLLGELHDEGDAPHASDRKNSGEDERAERSEQIGR